ncbi:SDR family oxidoreductase [Shimia haliotis]|uniref:UDP-glucose 4-epimerase n=1 Tax=Shimia haliotis TaxID=1280847 RepID=A0A1I4A385_9RHOB|nr:SDR family oxidoreductase [Shimia haliotis]SFK50401.1 UDP-glucose 4-epimerase [Shimia haliotis]
MSRVLITGAAGMVGRALLEELAATDHEVIASDLSEPPLPANARFAGMDVTSSDPERIIAATKPDVIIHLASIVTPPKGSGREFAYAVDVDGTQKVIDAAIAAGTRRLVVTSSGAAYGYHADNPVPLRETDAVRGNEEFPYAHHKRLVEEMLATTRASHPELEQVVLRVGTVLGQGTDNQITALFHKPRLLAIYGSDSPFVFIWTQDLARILAHAVAEAPAGIFNVAGNGAMSIDDLARALGKPVLRLPAVLLKAALAIAKPLGASRYGPEQVGFLQYRPVLDNAALKTTFGYTPQKTSREVFDYWKESVGL